MRVDLRKLLVGAAMLGLSAAVTPAQTKDLTLCCCTSVADPHSRWKAGDALSVELADPRYFDASGARIETRA